MNYDQKKVLVVGMARSGVAAAQLLRASGAVVTVNDSKPESELGDQLKRVAQEKFEAPHGHGMWMQLIRKNYL